MRSPRCIDLSGRHRKLDQITTMRCPEKVVDLCEFVGFSDGDAQRRITGQRRIFPAGGTRIRNANDPNKWRLVAELALLQRTIHRMHIATARPAGMSRSNEQDRVVGYLPRGTDTGKPTRLVGRCPPKPGNFTLAIWSAGRFWPDPGESPGDNASQHKYASQQAAPDPKRPFVSESSTTASSPNLTLC